MLLLAWTGFGMYNVITNVDRVRELGTDKEDGWIFAGGLFAAGPALTIYRLLF